MLTRIVVTTLTAVLGLCPAGTASAQDFAIDWFTIDGGGAMWTTGGEFELSGTIGQPDAGVVMTGGDFSLVGGFWPVTYYCRGDMNCDGQVNFGDINPFVLALTNPASYELQYPNCSFKNRDINGDGKCDFDDINPFVAILTGGGGPCP